ncbi:MAG: flagellar hook-associated protein FlgK [Paracoccus denitrificans]|nr:MAG: flagellar hook-associated protein FlgK [Paracoccus denitrificans]PZO85832.1 MAG: flagellar hook-associated protein FlgK [Paracoccus denitrificans]
MSLANALSNAMSGIRAAARGTEVVASNIANAATPGYARRELSLSARTDIAAGGGVRIDGVQRIVQQSILAQSRISGGELASRQTLAAHAMAMEKAIGAAGEAGGLSATLADFQSALIAATARPDDQTTLGLVADKAGGLVDKIRSIGAAIQATRTQADQAIATDVDRLNAGLKEVADLNRLITVQMATTGDANALMDRRQAVIDDLSQIVPLRETAREGGQVALYTKSGAALLNGAHPVQIAFRPSGAISPGMSVEGGQLHRLEIEGEPLTASEVQLFDGGRLSANFMIRDELTAEMQAQIDDVAKDIYDRFADPAVDKTLGPGQPGLFADRGGLFGKSTIGLAQRLSLNDAFGADSVWRLRDGLGTTAPSGFADASLLSRLSAALDGQRIVGGAGQLSAAGAAARLTEYAATTRVSAQDRQVGARAAHAALTSALAADGVDTDAEMEKLLQIERSYSANAKVLQAVDNMLQDLLRMT